MHSDDYGSIVSTNFTEAAMNVLQFLRGKLDFALWMVTRINGSDQIVLQTDQENIYGIKEGSTFHWPDTFCARMVGGQGPCIAPRSRDITAYANAPAAIGMEIGSYIGVPIRFSDGSMFGTVCAIDPREKPDSIKDDLPMIQVMADLLGNMLTAELAAVENSRRAERAEADTMIDAQTGLYNRRGWELLTQAEESRSMRYGHHLCCLYIDLDNIDMINTKQGYATGDAYITRAGKLIRSHVRAQDIAARIGDDEFAILLVECSRGGAKKVMEHLREVFAEDYVEASFGFAQFHYGGTIEEMMDEADQEVRAEKINKKSRKMN